MTQQRSIGRRRMLQGAGVAAGGVAVATVGLGAPAAADDDGGRLAGSWLGVRQDDGDPTEVKLVFSFALGGVIITHDILPAGPPFTGSWERRDHGRFRATIWSGFPGDEGPGSPGVAIRVRLRGHVDDGVLSGTYVFTVFDADGNELDSGPGSFRARRLPA